jgi:hypothetical protein
MTLSKDSMSRTGSNLRVGGENAEIFAVDANHYCCRDHTAAHRARLCNPLVSQHLHCERALVKFQEGQGRAETGFARALKNLQPLGISKPPDAAPGVRLSGGRPVFPEVPTRTEEVLASHGLDRGQRQVLDPEKAW